MDLASPALRWSVATLAALPAALAVLMLSGGDVLVAHGHAGIASRIPGNSVMPALATLPGTDGTAEMALAALRRAPLTGEALTWLGLEADSRGDRERGARLLALSAQTGWHDEWTQRHLYNSALRAGDAPAALRHAEALLHQGKGSDELFARFVQGMAVPQFRAAFLKAISDGPAWSRNFLMRHGHELDDRALLDVASVRAKARHGLDRDMAAALLPKLVRAGRVNTAAALWAMVPQAGPAGPGTLEWPDQLARNAPTPFDWNLPQGFAVEGEGNSELTATGTLPGEAAHRVLVLKPGGYRITALSASDWLWAAGCMSQTAVPNRRFSPDGRFTVSPDCPATVLTVAPVPGSQSARLGRIAVEPLQ